MGILIPLLVSSFSAAIAQFINKTLSTKGHKSTTYTSITMLTNALIALPLLFVQPHFSSDIFIWILIVVSVTVYGLSTALTFKAYKTTDISVVSIIQRLSIVFISFLGITILKETYTVKAYIGLFAILAGSVILVYKKSKWEIDSGIAMSVAAAFLGAVASVLDKRILFDFSPYSYVFINNLFIGIIFFLNKHTIREAPHLIKNHTLRIVGTSVLHVLSFAIVLVVLQKTDVSRTMPTYKVLTLIVTVLMGVLLLGEKSQLRQKIIGALLGIVGIFLMY